MKNFLHQLYIDNQGAPKSFNVTNVGEGSRIDLYDIIDDEYGVSAAAFVSALNGIKSGDIELHIDSPGGSVHSARTMVAAIASHPSTINAYVDGFAFSAASWLAMACNSVAMQAGAMMMVHKSSGLAFGNADDMKEMAAILDKLDETIVSDYVRKTGRPADELRAMMSPPTFMTAAEAVANKFADRVIENEKGRASNVWNLSAYGKVPAALATLPAKPAPAAPAPSMSRSNTNRLALLLAS